MIRDQRSEVGALHAALTNVFVGTITSSLVSSVAVVYGYLKNTLEGRTLWAWLSIEHFAFFEMCVIYYLLLGIGYREFFCLYDHRGIFTTSVIPSIDRQAPWIKQINYISGFAALVLYALLPISFIRPTGRWFWLFFVGLSVIDWTWAFLVDREVARRPTADATPPLVGRSVEELRRFQKYARQARYYDFNLCAWSLVAALMIPYLPAIVAVVFLTGLLLIVGLYGVLSTFHYRQSLLFAD